MSHDPWASYPLGVPPRDPDPDRPRRLLAYVHLYPPGHNAGAEMYLHAVLTWLQRHGWDVKVAATMTPAADAYEWEGVEVISGLDDLAMAAPYEWCDVALTHLDSTRRATAWSRRAQRPLVHLIHNHRQLDSLNVQVEDCHLAVWNSEWVAANYAWWEGPSMVVRPPVFSTGYAVDRGDHITLVNMTEGKGAAVFWELAARHPDWPFQAVLGAYGLQEVPDDVPANVLVVENGPDMRAVYERTRVLLVPSTYESWGRVAVEAMASGIPVVAAPTPGLVESTTDLAGRRCALLASPVEVDQWDAHLATLAEPGPYEHWSQAALRRSAELDAISEDDLVRFEAALRRLA